jgi:Na+/H+ antiporter NhaD/arsenite permease-like protein
MELGELLPIWSVLPFVGMLLSLAIFPLVKPEWWEKNELQVAIFWSLVFLIPFTIAFGMGVTLEKLGETILLDYIPFIALLLALFTVAGGIHVKGQFAGTTRVNVVFLALGTFLASWVGTTGAAMLLIRPLLRANVWRQNKAHIVVFFIFLVANIGGCLTPLGDPPLFLGYLRGVPFFWTIGHILPMLVLNTVALLVVFALLDRAMMKREDPHSLELMRRAAADIPFAIEGKYNFIFLAVIILAVILNGVIPQTAAFVNPDTGIVYGIELSETIHLGLNWFVQIAILLLAIFLSLHFTPRKLREDNEFTWDPIAEVAKLFIGIFITMIPALAILAANGSNLGIDSPMKFFWITGALSSFLDNSPTYVVFLTTAGSLGTTAANAVATTVGAVDPRILLAISAGAVFMGANTYIGNAPNFMVKNISEANGVKMPSFFGYMKWSVGILVPLFIIDGLLFLM